MAVPFTRLLAKILGWRAIFIAPTKLKRVYILPFNGVLTKPWNENTQFFMPVMTMPSTKYFWPRR